MALHPRLRVLLIFSVAFISVSAFVWFINERRGLWRNAEAVSSLSSSAQPAVEATTEITTETTATPTADATSTPEAAPSPFVSAPIEPPPQSSPSPFTVVVPTPPAETGAALLIPVAGVSFDKLQNTFKDSRSDGRVHDAIDIMAPGGTPVIACTDGRIAKLFQSERGGITLYQLSADERTVFYYAHLPAYAPGITEGKPLRRGDLIGYVGDTGNAGAGNFHLHFAVSQIDDPRDIHGGINLNPYDLFRPR